MSLDIIPVHASAVSCERLFSGGGLTETSQRSRLGGERFEEMQLMKGKWRPTIVDWAKMNEENLEVIDEWDEFETMYFEDEQMDGLDKVLGE